MKLSTTHLTYPQIERRLPIFLLVVILSIVSLNIAIAQDDRPQAKEFTINGQKFKHKNRVFNDSRSTCNRIQERSFDGTCNNVVNDQTAVWGATDIPLLRKMNAAYGLPDYLNDMGGNCRISARGVSNLIAAQSEDLPSPRNLSSLVFTWGQFIDHDIDLTPEGHSEYVPVLLTADEPLFTAPIPFFRSAAYAGSGIDAPRDQQNIISSWLDASQVYGSDEERADWLRTNNRGKLKTSTGNLLPYNTVDGELSSAIDETAPSMAGDGGGTAKVFVAGDVRANEQPGLTALHTLFVLEHNRICDQLSQQGSNNDEQNYQRARKEVGGYIQRITYAHFLPALGINLPQYTGYKSNVQPDISNMFATAAYRLGHTMVTNEIPVIDKDCQAVGSGSIALLDGFFNPTVMVDYGVDAILQGLAAQQQQKVDAKIVDNLRNFLFPVPGSNETFGLDLASLNIQRGRDHGLPDYNSVRAYYTGYGVSSFSEITSDPALQLALEKAYGSVYDMDLWVGLLSEDPLAQSSLGLTLTAILSDQFSRIRDADFYFYENDPFLPGQTRNRIQDVSLEKIIDRNTEISSLQQNVFFARDCQEDNPGPGGNGGGHGGGPGGDGGGPGGNGGGPGSPDDSNNRAADSNIWNTDLLQSQDLIISPNPNFGRMQVQATLEKRNANLLMQVQSLDGKIVWTEKTSLADRNLFLEMDLSALEAGMYILTITGDKEAMSQKFVIQSK